MVASFYLTVLPEIIRLIILAIFVLWKFYRLVSSNYKYMSMINKKSSKFVYRRNHLESDFEECAICLSEFVEGEKGRELECKHMFHRHCVEKWLQEYKATCPLCRSSIVSEEILAEYHRVKDEQNNSIIEKELALILLSIMHGGTCHGF
ncbi:RING-type domain-containing protein [Abeliophyllum distichum]|uniref:RING-type domain-containing protein n=1 Tax=Abeliophyllum distichum TaxID=126358 RepID=A0ABD1SSV3_9LAMI